MNKEELELHKSDGGDFYTNPNYWDCECDADYIHKKTEKESCAKCSTSHEEQPDSRQNEIDELKQEPNLWSVNLNTIFKNVLFNCTEDELEENVRTFVVSELENLDWTYEKADVNVSKTMIRS